MGRRFIERTVVLSAPPDMVWPYLLHSELVGTWFGGEVTMEPAVGGRLRWRCDERRFAGVVTAVQPCRRLSWRWWAGEVTGLQRDRVDVTEVTISLAAVNGGTRLTVVEAVHEPAVAPSDPPRAAFGLLPAGR